VRKSEANKKIIKSVNYKIFIREGRKRLSENDYEYDKRC
jgi:hypothetical protein